jgi:hypothetical protein
MVAKACVAIETLYRTRTEARSLTQQRWALVVYDMRTSITILLSCLQDFAVLFFMHERFIAGYQRNVGPGAFVQLWYSLRCTYPGMRRRKLPVQMEGGGSSGTRRRASEC